MAMKRIHFVARGKVQQVYFRVFTVKAANECQVTGWVMNRQSGKEVEGEAQGDEESINKFLDMVRQGPKDAVVEGVEVENVKIKSGGVEEKEFRKVKWGEARPI
jgi:acylphosphatase